MWELPHIRGGASHVYFGLSRAARNMAVISPSAFDEVACVVHGFLARLAS
jgi:hypothetical protein